MTSHKETPSYRPKPGISPGVFQNKFGDFDEQGAQLALFVKYLNERGIKIDAGNKTLDVDYLGSCSVQVGEDYYCAIESKRRAQ